CGVGFIQDVLQARLRVKPEIEIKDHQWVKEQVYTVESRKPVRFLDKRGLSQNTTVPDCTD
ncbi:MAG: hypothetical protein ABIK21_06175, partial [bacterium]